MLKRLYSLSTQCFNGFNLNKPSLLEFEGAGCLFTDDTYVLAGYQPNKRKATISGFGGKRLPGETYLQTALREMIEELFGIIPQSFTLVYIAQNISIKSAYMNGTYVVVQYSFEDLEHIIEHLGNSNESSKLYKSWPHSIEDLIFSRAYKPNSEVAQLCILPLAQNLEISKEFVKDLNEKLRCEV